MSSFNDLRCEKCKAKIGFLGEMKDCPPCPKCGHVQDPAKLNEIEEKLAKAREELLKELEDRKS
jgi:transcription initiation factor IIE alpha subunit